LAVLYPLHCNGIDTGIRLAQAATFSSRLFGLLTRSKLGAQEGLWIQPCQRIHTLGMRLTLDVIMLDQAGTVVSHASMLRPWRLGPVGQHGGSAVELASGSIDRCGIITGDRLTLGDP